MTSLLAPPRATRPSGSLLDRYLRRRAEAAPDTLAATQPPVPSAGPSAPSVDSSHEDSFDWFAPVVPPAPASPAPASPAPASPAPASPAPASPAPLPSPDPADLGH